MFDPDTSQTYLYRNSSAVHYHFDPDVQRYYGDFDIVDINGIPVTDMTDLHGDFATLKRRDGYSLKFELMDMAAPVGDADKYQARLLSITDLNGFSIDFTYKTWTQAEIDVSPERQLQIDTITDAYGVVATATYHTTQFNGRWVMEKMDVVNYGPQSVELKFAYDPNDHLMEIKRDNSVVVTYDYGLFAAWDAAMIGYTNWLDPTPSGKGYIYLSDEYQLWNGSVANQFAGAMLGRSDGFDYRYMRIVADQDNPGTYMIENSGQLMRWVQGHSLQYIEDWDIDPNGTGVGLYTFDPNTQETCFAINPDSTPDQACKGDNPTTTDETGYTTIRLYDDNVNNIKKTHPDDTYELMLYNDENLITYYRDRGGYVTVYERDTSGNILRVIRGVKDNDDNVDDEGFMVVPGSKPLQTIYGYNANKLVEWTTTNAYAAGPVQAPPVSERTDYEYYANFRPKSITKPLPHGQSVRPKIEYTWSGAQLVTIKNERGNDTGFIYDGIGRVVNTFYADGSSVHVWFDDANEVIYVKDRNGVVAKRERDDAWRQTTVTRAYGHDTNLFDQTIDTVHPVYEQMVASYLYYDGQTAPKSVINNGAESETAYDYRGRAFESIRHPSVGVEHKTTRKYECNMLFSTEDDINGYIRRSYLAYSSDRQTVRTVSTRDPSIQYTSNAALLALTRQFGANPTYAIQDAVRDVRGNIVQMFDERNTETRTDYDELSRVVKRTQAFGLPIALVNESEYDTVGNLVTTTDAAGTDTTFTYDPAGNTITQTLAAGTSISLTTSYEYDIDGAQRKVTAPSTAVTQYFRDDCCGHSSGTRNGLGHGQVSNQNVGGQTVHSAVVEDYDLHTNLLDPLDTKTLSETTTKYFDNGRVKYRTIWKSALGTLDPADPPIAGIGGVSATDGVTTQHVYDDNLSDGVGLDDSTNGISIAQLGGGTANIDVVAAINKLSDTVANGGAGLTFAANRSASASVTISPDELVTQISISDAAGSGVMTATMTGPAATTPNQLINWSCSKSSVPDTTTLAFTALKNASVDPDGNTVASLSDGFGRAIASIDQLGNQSSAEFDSAGSVTKSTDALGHDTTFTYDELGRQLTVVDALSNTRTTVYDASTGRVSSRTDAKSKSTSFAYDALGRVLTQNDRLGKITYNAYDSAGRLSGITDAENRATTYGYNILGQRTSTTLADNSARAMTYDAAGRLKKVDLPSGKSQTTVYEFSGVVDKVEYRDTGGTLVGTDDLTYDANLRRTGSTSRYGVVRALAYDDRGQLDTDTTTYGGQSYQVGYDYDDRGRLTEITYPSGRKAAYTFETRGSLDAIKWDGSQIEGRSYNNGGLLTGVDRPFVDETRVYDNVNRITSIANTNVGTGSYTYDANGNKLTESWTGVMSAWNFTTQSGGSGGYDDEDRFVNFIQSGQSKTIGLTRSDIGNITNVDLNGTGTARGYSNVHELTSMGASSQTFDADGNLTVAHSGVDHAWDEAGMLRQTIVSAGDTAGIEGTNEYGYDASQKRVWKKITRSGSVAEHTVYVYAGPNCIAEYPSGTAATSPDLEYIYAQAIDSLVMIVRNNNAQKLTVTRNQQWSVSALADNANGSVLERYTYDVFGKRTILAADGTTVRTASSYDNPYGYTSRRHDDESGLMYFRARYYDPTTGEFASQDPLEFVDGMSSYRGYFVFSGVDPSGNENHHWFPQEFEVEVFNACGRVLDIDRYTEFIEQPWHNWLHNAWRGPNGFNNAFNDIIDHCGDNCCCILRNGIGLMYNARQALFRAMGRKRIPELRTRPWPYSHYGGKLFWTQNDLIDMNSDLWNAACRGTKPKCQAERIRVPNLPEVPLPFYVPGDPGWDFLQDAGVCVVIAGGVLVCTPSIFGGTVAAETPTILPITGRTAGAAGTGAACTGEAAAAGVGICGGLSLHPINETVDKCAPDYWWHWRNCWGLN